MCGFIGMVNLHRLERTSFLDRRFDNAYQRLKARGPDSRGIWVDKNIYFLHTRLKILDLSSDADQPMKKSNYVICFNGEIYNYHSLKEDLIKNGHSFKSSGDTEVLIAAWKEWGDSMLKRLDGMFSMAIWDIKNKTLFLARDRFGKKPLVYCIKNNSIYFASDIKSLNCVVPGGKVNKDAIHSLLRFRFIHEPITIYKDFKKLSAGSFMKFNKYGNKTKAWFTLKSKVQNSKKINISNIKNTITNAVSKRLVSDVPLGIFLSGGLDSAIIMDSIAQLGKKIPTFTVGFKNVSNYYDESYNAKKISKYYGFHNKTIYLNQKNILKSIDNVLDANDEPFADSSSIAMYMISNTVKNDIKVALTGDGGDELFGGYRKYISYKWLTVINFLPNNIRKLLIRLLSDQKESNTLDLMRKMKRFLTNYDSDLDIMQINYLEQLSNIEFNQLFGLEKKCLPKNIFKGTQSFKGINKILARDFKFSLLGDMLVKLDRQSMANGLEVRSPLLDQDLVKLSFEVPGKEKVGFLNGKKILRECYKNSLPKWYMNLPKKGFEVPLQKWLRNDLKYLVEEATKPIVLESLDIKNNNIISKWKEDFYSTKKDYSWRLWTFISYYHWAKKSKII